MDNLPQSNQSGTLPPASRGGEPQIGSMAKETGPHIAFAEGPVITEVGQEVPLAPEVASAGVTIHPTTVQIPVPVAQLGVKATGPAAPVSDVAAIVLPLTDDQIANGLHQSIMSSWRWLAEWCTKQLRQAHYMLKFVHGKIVRTKT